MGGHEECVRVLLGSNADVHAKMEGVAGLHFASMGGHKECVLVLLEWKADVAAVSE
eukprot:CAMPEP_0181336602 /NCGR_PEP_ID=MMETSP1101-20121128/27518_1 /TAXON_ID=46948 /ORGANISM="Rhodomonas abbreviata, Strain Caron Lab Isolate" /LENGTH=55 /DNA_ID=CAMNT_0023446931 /DNA_START=1 /DNA_END=165 /DNA_ORIENTATION=-